MTCGGEAGGSWAKVETHSEGTGPQTRAEHGLPTAADKSFTMGPNRNHLLDGVGTCVFHGSLLVCGFPEPLKPTGRSETIEDRTGDEARKVSAALESAAG